MFNSQPVTLDSGGRITAFNGNTLQYNRRESDALR
jgi:hypothetical protein